MLDLTVLVVDDAVDGRLWPVLAAEGDVAALNPRRARLEPVRLLHQLHVVVGSHRAVRLHKRMFESSYIVFTPGLDLPP